MSLWAALVHSQPLLALLNGAPVGGEGGLVDHDHLPLLALQLQDGSAAGGGGGGGGDRRDERGEQAEGPHVPHGPTVHHHHISHIFNSRPGKTEKQSCSSPNWVRSFLFLQIVSQFRPGWPGWRLLLPALFPLPVTLSCLHRTTSMTCQLIRDLTGSENVWMIYYCSVLHLHQRIH